MLKRTCFAALVVLFLLLSACPHPAFASAIARFYGRTLVSSTGATNPGLATGTPDTLYATLANTSNVIVGDFVDATYSEANNGNITAVWVICNKKVDAAFANDQFNLRYNISGTWGATTLTEVPTNLSFEEANVYVTGDRTWTWADIRNMQAQARYIRSGRYDGRQLHVDTLGIVVRTALRCQGTSLIAANVSQGQPLVPVESVAITSFNGGTALINGFSVDRLGTSLNSDVSQVYIYEDTNQNNTIDPSDLLLGQSAVTADPQTVTFATPMSITAQTKRVIIAYDIATTAVAGRTVGARLANTAAVLIQAPDTVQNVNFPITSNLATIRTPPNIAYTLSPTPTSVLTGQAITITGTVTNSGQTAAVNLTPSALSVNQVSGGDAILSVGPTPASMTLAAGGSSSFSWTYTAQTSGIINFSGNMTWLDANSQIASNSNVTTSANVTITTNPGSSGITTSLAATPQPTVNTNYSPITLTMTVTNVSANPVLNITPSAITMPGLPATNLSGPTPTNFASLNPAEVNTFTWTYQSQATTGNLYFRGNALVNGGPASSVVSNSNFLQVQTPAALAATMTALPTTANLGSQVLVRLAVQNTGMATAGSIVPATNLVVTGGNVSKVSGPEPAIATLSQNAIATFAWTYEITAPLATNRTFSTTATGTDRNSLTPVSTPVKSVVVNCVSAVTPRWSFPAGTVAGGFNGVPTTQENVVLTGANDSKVYALDMATGQQKWVFSTSGIILSPIVTIYDDDLGRDLILVSSQDNKIYCLIDYGTFVVQRWEAFYGGPPPAAFRAAPITDGTYVYIGGEDGYVRCLNLSNGQARAGWTNTAIGAVRSTTAVQDGFVLVGSAGTNRVYRLNPDGTVHSSYLTGAAVIGSPFIWNSRLYAVSDLLYCLNPSNLTQLYWSYAFGSTSQSSPWFDFDTDYASGPIVFGTENNYVRAVRDNGNSGTLSWSFLASGTVRTNPLVAGDRVLFGDSSGRIFSLNRADGTLRSGWPYNTGSAINSSPAVNDSLTQFFIGSSNGKFYCFDINQ